MEPSLSVNNKLIGKHKYTLPFVDKSKIRWKLDVNENFYPPHPSVIEAVSQCAERSLYEYPYPDEKYKSLLRRICDYCNKTRAGDDLLLQPNNITLTNGSDTAIEIIFRALIPPGAKVILPIPTFPQVELFLDLLDCKISRVTAESAEDFVTMSIEKHNVIYITTPNLPLGYQLSRVQIEDLAKKNPHVWFVVDEAYYEFGNFESSATLVTNLKNVIVLRTFSKAFALASMRIGYFLAHSETAALIAPLVNDKSVNVPAIWAADAALKNHEYYLEIMRDVEAQKKYVGEELEKIGVSRHGSAKAYYDSRGAENDELPIFAYRMDGGAFFLLFCQNPQRVCKIFAEHGIMVRNKDGDWCKSVRISLAPKHMMDDVLRVCKFINVKHFFKGVYQGASVVKPIVSFDLDLTLRDGSTLLAPLYPGAAEIISLDNIDAHIITNNNCRPSTVKEYFEVRGINLLEEKITTSLSSAREYLLKGDHCACILGDKNILTYFIDDDGVLLYTDEIYRADCMFLAWINISFKDIMDICSALAEGKTLIYTDKSETCAVKSSSEFGHYAESGLVDADTCIPDMQSIIDIIVSANPQYAKQIICVGKPNIVSMHSGCDILIGDTMTDQEQAKEFGAMFILVNDSSPGAARRSRYNFERNCIEFANITELYQAITQKIF